jgi:acetylornithine deacetylase
VKSGPDNAVEERVLGAIDLDALLGHLHELIAIESLGGRETPAQEYVAGVMRSIGMEVDAWEIDLDRLRRHPAYGVEIERQHAMGVVGRLGQGGGPSLILNGHVDVVSAGELDRWTRPPWEGTVSGGRVYGRGSADMKGGLCCALFAAKAVRDAGVSLGGSVLVESVVGEEDGGVGTLAAIERGYRADGAVVMEPTGLVVAPAQAGAYNFRVTVAGRAAHGALASEGVNPIDKFLPIYGALRDFERGRNQAAADPLFSDYEVPYALSVGTLRAGVWPSTVPESLTVEGRLGIGVGEDPQAVKLQFERAVADSANADPWLRAHPPRVEWWGACFDPAVTPTDHPVVAAVCGSYESVVGARPVVRGMPYGADMRLLVNEGGTPTVIFGPGDVRNAHAPDEFVEVAELETATRTLALTILRFCGVGG